MVGKWKIVPLLLLVATFHTNVQLTSCRPQVQWHDPSTGLPSTVFVAVEEPQCNLSVSLNQFGLGLILGYFEWCTDDCVYAYGGQVFRSKNCKVLLKPSDSSYEYIWKPGFGSMVPKGAVQGASTYGGGPLYVGRSNVNGSFRLGQIHRNHGRMYYAVGAEERYTFEYEALVLQDSCASTRPEATWSWVGRNDPLPSNAFTFQQGGSTKYVGRIAGDNINSLEVQFVFPCIIHPRYGRGCWFIDEDRHPRAAREFQVLINPTSASYELSWKSVPVGTAVTDGLAVGDTGKHRIPMYVGRAIGDTHVGEVTYSDMKVYFVSHDSGGAASARRDSVSEILVMREREASTEA